MNEIITNLKNQINALENVFLGVNKLDKKNIVEDKNSENLKKNDVVDSSILDNSGKKVSQATIKNLKKAKKKPVEKKIAISKININLDSLTEIEKKKINELTSSSEFEKIKYLADEIFYIQGPGVEVPTKKKKKYNFSFKKIESLFKLKEKTAQSYYKKGLKHSQGKKNSPGRNEKLSKEQVEVLKKFVFNRFSSGNPIALKNFSNFFFVDFLYFLGYFFLDQEINMLFGIEFSNYVYSWIEKKKFFSKKIAKPMDPKRFGVKKQELEVFGTQISKILDKINPHLLGNFDETSLETPSKDNSEIVVIPIEFEKEDIFYKKVKQILNKFFFFFFKLFF